jgi:putative ABC transport system permease protein
VHSVAMIVRKSLRQHALSTTVTALSVALGCGLLMSVFVVKRQMFNAFTGSTGGFHAVVGARGSQLQLVLNSVFHLEKSPGNVPWSLYEQLKSHPEVTAAYGYAMGDNYRGFRIIGTESRLLADHEYTEGRRFSLAAGRVFDAMRREAVIGSFVAQKTGLGVGDHFHSYHNLDFSESHRHDDEFLIVGILEPTNTPMDRVLWVPIEAYFRMQGHTLQGSGQTFIPDPTEPIPEEHKELSAVMLVLRGGGFRLEQEINDRGSVATFARTGSAVAELFNRIGWADRVLAIVAYMVVLVAGGSILASLYNTMNERRREFAILRALGARRQTVFAAIVAESAAIAMIGTLVGYIIYAGLLGATAAIVRQRTGVVLELTAWHPVLVLTPIGMTLLGALAGVVPAVKAYSTDVASNLVPQS